MINHLVKHPQQLAPLIRALRRQAGLSQAALASRLGVSHQAISQLEKQPERVTVERLMRVLGALKIDLVLRPRTVATSSHNGDW